MGLFDAVKLELETHPKAITIKRNPLDMSAAKEQFSHHLETINTMLESANEHNINSQSALEQAVGMAGEAKRLYKTLEAKRKEMF